MKNLLGIYEKALPIEISWFERLQLAKELGFDFVEISIDEKDFRLERLYASDSEIQMIKDAISKSGIPLMSMCFSGHRRYPLGSRDPEIRAKALELMQRAIDFSVKLGIRVIQMAGYDVYYEEAGEDTAEMFRENLGKCVKMAERSQVMLAMEIMDTSFLNSNTKYMEYNQLYNSPWFCVYPDLGNLSAWGNDVVSELKLGFNRTVAIHLKDTIPPEGDQPGKFKCVPFGSGCVDFQKCLKTLKELDYAAPFMIEMWSGETSTDPASEIIAAKAWLMDHLEKAGF